MFDDFDGPAGAPPNPEHWAYAYGSGLDAGVEEYVPDNAALDGEGHLVIRADNTAGGYNSGRVQTKDRVEFGYGTLTARIKMPSGHGLWPAFWLVGSDENSNPWPGSGEIDVVEFVSDAETHYSALHGPMRDSTNAFQQAQISGTGSDLSQDFHNYWMTHTENAITVGVDDTTWGTFTPDSIPADATWVFNKPFYAILNLAVGGSWAGPPDDSTRFPATMLVDWVSWNPL
ncbi:MAG: glycoside hydrolase family 16 protein [Mycobacterium sp.]|nr:glycoside hydrolase family 16 protein [Mycobacterium sp.]